MYKSVVNYLIILLSFSSCSTTPPNISVVCEENNVGNCIIKWETAPLIKGQVKVYISNNPETISEDTPIATANIADGKMTIVNSDPTHRYFYLMVFNEKYRVKVSSRNINIPGIQNFRDLGGYKSNNSEGETRWGMLYRSAQMDSLNLCACKELCNIGIKTIIDLRTKNEQNSSDSLKRGFNIIHIPIAAGNMESILHGVEKGQIKSDTIYRLIERQNQEMVAHYQKEYKKIFSILLNRDNYPIVIHCTSGKGRTGIVSAIILAALGVNEDIIMEDYRLSNYYFNIPNASKYAYSLSTNSQEAITTIYSAKEDFLNAAKEQIEKKYGTVNNYLREGIGLSQQEIDKLKEILLVKE